MNIQNGLPVVKHSKQHMISNACRRNCGIRVAVSRESQEGEQLFDRSLLDICADESIKLPDWRATKVHHTDFSLQKLGCPIRLTESWEEMMEPVESRFEKTDYYYHYTSAELGSFYPHLRSSSWVTTSLYRESMTAQADLGMKQMPTMVVLVKDVEKVCHFNRDSLHWQNTRAIPCEHLGPAMKLVVPTGDLVTLDLSSLQM